MRLEPYQVNLCPLGVQSQNSIWLLGQGSYRGAANRDGAVNVCFGNGRGNNVLEEAEGTDLVCVGLNVVEEGVLVQSCARWLRREPYLGGKEQLVHGEQAYCPPT